MKADSFDTKTVIPQHVRDYAAELARDPARALDFMQRAGNVDADGELHPKFTSLSRPRTMLY